MSPDVAGAPTISALAGSAPQTSVHRPRWVAAVVIAGALAVTALAYAALFSPTTVLAAGQHMAEWAKVWSRYPAASDASLGIALLLAAISEVLTGPAAGVGQGRDTMTLRGTGARSRP